MWSRRGAAAERGRPLRAPAVGPGEQPRAGPGEGGGGGWAGPLCRDMLLCVTFHIHMCKKQVEARQQVQTGPCFLLLFPEAWQWEQQGVLRGREVGVRESSILEAVLGREFSEAGVGDEEGQGL